MVDVHRRLVRATVRCAPGCVRLFSLSLCQVVCLLINPALGIIDSVCRHVRCGMIFFFAGLRSLTWMVRRPGVQRVLDTTWLRLVRQMVLGRLGRVWLSRQMTNWYQYSEGASRTPRPFSQSGDIWIPSSA